MLGFGDAWSGNVILIVADKEGSPIQFGEAYSGGSNQTFTSMGVTFTAGGAHQLWINTPQAGSLYDSAGNLISHVTTLNTNVQVLGVNWNAPHKTYYYWNFD